MHWKNNDLVTHVDNDYLQCDIYDFPGIKILYSEILDIKYSDKRITVAPLYVISSAMLLFIIILFGVMLFGSKHTRPDLIVSTVIILTLIITYVYRKTLHYLKNRRRMIYIRLKNGTQGTFIEMEDDKRFKEIQQCIAGNLNVV